MSKGGAKSKKRMLAEVFGWVGTTTIILAYVLVTFKVVPADGFWYAFLNLVGAIGIITIALTKGVMQSVVLNVIWAVVAIVALFKFFMN